MKVYGLRADGRLLHLEGATMRICKYVFRSREEAHKHIPDFLARAIEDRGGLAEMDPEGIDVRVLDFELVEESEAT